MENSPFISHQEAHLVTFELPQARENLESWPWISSSIEREGSSAALRASAPSEPNILSCSTAERRLGTPGVSDVNKPLKTTTISRPICSPTSHIELAVHADESSRV
jgi:hypothetical protein